MELILVHIEKYKGITNSNLIVSPNFKLDGHDILYSDKITNDLAITNAIAIVGKNGMGKTSILEAIIKILFGESDEISGICIFKSEGKVFYKGYVKNKQQFTFNGNEINRWNNSKNIDENTKVVFYSPVYNPHSDNGFLKIRKSNYINVSNDFEFKFAKDKNREKDIELQLDFIFGAGTYFEDLIYFPKFLKIDFKAIEIEDFYKKLILFLENAISSRNKESRNLVSKFIYDFNLHTRNGEFQFGLDSLSEVYENPEDWDVYLIELSLLFQDIETMFHEFISNNSPEEGMAFSIMLKKVFNSFSFQKNQNKGIQDNIKLFEVFFTIIKSKRFYEIRENLDNIRMSKKISEFFDFEIFEIIEKLKSIKRANFNLADFPIVFGYENSNEVISLLKDLRKNGLLKYGFEVRWDSISSGQLARLNMFGRLYKSIMTGGESFYFLLDEADIYLHPEWQRTFMSDLNLFLSRIRQMKNIKDIHVVLTTHSPIMISDFYREQVYLFKDLGNEKVLLKSSARTFGANLYDLYNDEFFINRPVGEIAKKEIDERFDYISKNITSENAHQLLMKNLKFIDQIGDDIERDVFYIALKRFDSREDHDKF